MVRTQVYLTKEEQTALKSLARRTGKSQSELIRLAIENLISIHQGNNRLQLLRPARGIWKDRGDLPDFITIRAEWDRVNLR